MSPTKERAAFYVDGSNFFKHCERLRIYSHQIEWDVFLEDLANGRQIEFANYYDAPRKQDAGHEGYIKQQQFFEHLKLIDWIELRLGRLEYRRDKTTGVKVLVEKGVDTRIAADMVRGAAQDLYDVAYLLSADGDFSYVVKDVQSFGKRVIVATPGTSYHLTEAADVFIHLRRETLREFRRKQGGP